MPPPAPGPCTYWQLNLSIATLFTTHRCPVHSLACTVPHHPFHHPMHSLASELVPHQHIPASAGHLAHDLVQVQVAVGHANDRGQSMHALPRHSGCWRGVVLNHLSLRWAGSMGDSGSGGSAGEPVLLKCVAEVQEGRKYQGGRGSRVCLVCNPAATDCTQRTVRLKVKKAVTPSVALSAPWSLIHCCSSQPVAHSLPNSLKPPLSRPRPHTHPTPVLSTLRAQSIMTALAHVMTLMGR